MCDRTIEFKQCVAGLSQASIPGSKKLHEIPLNKTGFHNTTAEIATGIHRTTTSLSELTKLVRKQGLFDDPTDKINNLIVRIKEDIADLNSKCDAAQQYVENSKKQRTMPNQTANHNLNVVSSLKTELLHATQGFKTTLELRSSKMKDQQEKKLTLAGTSTLSPLNHMLPTPSTINSKEKFGNSAMSTPPTKLFELSNPYALTNNNNNNNNQFDGSNHSQQPLLQQQQQQQQLMLIRPPTQYQYYEQRQESVDEVTKTIGELGQLFKRLSTMISEQQQLVERIDEDIESSVMNADLAHKELIKSYESVSNNKKFAMKIIGILVAFIIFFIIFLM